MTRRRLTVLGSTGSVGTQTLEVARRYAEKFDVVGLAAGGSEIGLLARQAVEFEVERVAIADASRIGELKSALAECRSELGHSPPFPEILSGSRAAAELAGLSSDVVLNGITGSIGLEPTLAALAAGAKLALANKESLIVGGSLVTGAAGDGQILPVDSEHAALAQAMQGAAERDVERLIVTASGGPFKGRTRQQLDAVTPAQALAHPTWDMGKVITTNSATMVNKGLEVIEAHLLFDIPMDRIDVTVHPQSIVHSMVQFTDGSLLAQASPPDMRLPIAWALSHPNRLRDVAPACDFSAAGGWTFEPLDENVFKAVRLARECGVKKGIYPAVFNAANEELVEAFHSRLIGFLDIVDFVENVLDRLAKEQMTEAELTLDTVLGAECWARRAAWELVSKSPRDLVEEAK